MKIYLASKSPRRQELLLQMGVDFDYIAQDVPEITRPNETAKDYSMRITTEKLEAAWNAIISDQLSERPVLCADTEVILDQHILGKARDYQDAFLMLKSYSGRSHEVITTVGVKYREFQKLAMDQTRVYFAEMTDNDIHEYLKTGNYKDKAGAYGIQSQIAKFIYRIDGCFYSVMGLPLHLVRLLLKELESV